ncbi:MAG: hypothetical protein C0490_24240, partial [Marivirga sp.]|nr:hypothetical protein [Marivirga sp.]
PYLKKNKKVCLAAINSAASCVVSGPDDAIGTFKDVVEEAGFKTKSVRSFHAGHSYMMDAMLEEFEHTVNQIEKHPQKIPFISNLTGKKAIDEELTTSKYWVKHLRHTVKFSEGIQEIMQKENVLFIEVGLGKTLSSFVGSSVSKKSGHRIINLLGHPKEECNDISTVLSAVGKLWESGVEPDWKNVYVNETRHRVSLPGYSFDAIQYPADVDDEQICLQKSPDKQVLRKDIANWCYSPTWEVSNSSSTGRKSNSVRHFNIFFSNDNSFESLLGKELEEIGEDVVYVTRGEAFNKIDDQKFEINPAFEDDYSKLFEKLKTVSFPLRVVFNWGISEPAQDTNIDEAQRQLDNGFYALLNISKGLNSADINTPVEIISLTNNLHQVLTGDVSTAEKAPILAAIKVIPKENNRVSCRNIDIVWQEINNKLLIKDVFNEIISEPDCNIVAFRYGTRFKQTIKPI